MDQIYFNEEVWNTIPIGYYKIQTQVEFRIRFLSSRSTWDKISDQVNPVKDFKFKIKNKISK